MTVQAEAERVAGTDERRGVAIPAILLGLGLGGFVDGIVLHQILQWHHLISSTEKSTIDTVAGLKANMLADGLFHAATWLLTVAGLWWLWKNAPRRKIALDRQFLGWLIFGWGLFNVLDEVVFHALLDLHHIREGDNELTYDIGFSALGVAQLLVGWLFVRSGRKRFAEGFQPSSTGRVPLPAGCRAARRVRVYRLPEREKQTHHRARGTTGREPDAVSPGE